MDWQSTIFQTFTWVLLVLTTSILLCCLPTTVAKVTPFFWLHKKLRAVLTSCLEYCLREPNENKSFSEVYQDWKNSQYRTLCACCEPFTRGFACANADSEMQLNFNMATSSLPPKASFFRVKRKTVNAVQLEWKFGGWNCLNDPNQYVVELQSENGWVEVFRTREDYCMITELSPNTVYVMRIFACSSKGKGPVTKMATKTKFVPNQWHGSVGEGFYWMQDATEISLVFPMEGIKEEDVEFTLDERLLIRVKDTVLIDGIIWFPYGSYSWKIHETEDTPLIIVSISKKVIGSCWPWPIKGIDQVEAELINFDRNGSSGNRIKKLGSNMIT